MSAPKIMTIPILLNVPLNPSPIIAGILASGMPATIASAREISISAKNGWTPALEIKKIITTTAMAKQMINATPLIKAP